MIHDIRFRKKNKILQSSKYRIIFPSLVIIFFLVAYFQVTDFTRPSPINHIPILPVLNSEHIRGNPDATVTVIEYSDFECPECQYFQPTIKQILETYGRSIRWIVRPYPLPQHANAEKEAEAGECVASLGGNDAYWKFNDLLFSKEIVTTDGTGFPLASLTYLAQNSGVDLKKFSRCLNNGKFYHIIQQSVDNATKAGITELPSVVIINQEGDMQLITGDQPFMVFQSVISQTLKK